MKAKIAKGAVVFLGTWALVSLVGWYSALAMFPENLSAQSWISGAAALAGLYIARWLAIWATR